MSAIHRLKTWPIFFAEVRSGAKPFEARKDDRNFQVGDTLILQEWSNHTEQYTGEEETRIVTYILRGTEHVAQGFCILGMTIPRETELEAQVLALTKQVAYHKEHEQLNCMQAVWFEEALGFKDMPLGVDAHELAKEELRDMIAQLDTLTADSEMLDWIEMEAKKSRTGISFDHVNYVEDGQVLERGFRYMRQHRIDQPNKSIRDAIKNAMGR